jgi:hypothetical protein
MMWLSRRSAPIGLATASEMTFGFIAMTAAALWFSSRNRGMTARRNGRWMPLDRFSLRSQDDGHVESIRQ